MSAACGTAQRLLDRIAGTAEGTPLATLAPLLGVIAVKDLMLNDVPFVLVATRDELHLPFVRGLPTLPPNDLGRAAAFLLLVVAFVAALGMIAGRLARPAAAVLATIYGWAFLANQLFYANNVLLFIVLTTLCAVEPLDPARPSPVYPAWLARGLVSAIYATGAIVKLKPAWWSGRILGQAFVHYHYVYNRYLGFRVPVVFAGLAIVSILVEASLAVGLWLPQIREKVAIVGCLFHASIEVLLPVRTFSFLMMASYVLFLSPERLAQARAWRARTGASGALAVGVGVAVGLNLTFSWMIHSQDELPPRNIIALLLACVFVASMGGLFPWLRSPPGGGTALTPRALRAPIVAVLALLELFCVVKPAFGYTNRFAWRMFTEVLRTRVAVRMRTAEGWEDYEPRAPVANPWSGDEFQYHWDSLGEQRAQLEAYAQWILSERHDALEVQVVTTYERDGVAGKDVIEVRY